VFTPLNVSVPELDFCSDPVLAPSAITPANVPLLNVNAVPSKTTEPLDAPSNVNNVTAEAESVTAPLAVKAAVTGTAAPDVNVRFAPLKTEIAVEANRELPIRLNVPALTAVVPVKVLAPLNVNVPAVALVSDPADVPSSITPPKVPLPTVKAVPFRRTRPVEDPSNVNNVTAAGDKVIIPSAVKTVELGIVAGAKSSNAPELPTVNAVDAKEPALTRNTPPFTATEPVAVFTPLRSNAPAPTFTREPALDPSSITPAKLPAPTVNAVESNLNVPVPAPLRAASVTADPYRFTRPSTPNVVVADNVAPLSTRISPPTPTPIVVVTNSPPAPNVKTPSVTLNAPLNVFTPVIRTLPAPNFVKAPLPEITPRISTPLAAFNEVAAVRTPSPLKTKAPLFVASPKVIDPLKLIAFDNERAVTPSLESRPPENTNVPVPSAESFPAWIAPAINSTPPMKSFAPLNVRTDEPFFRRIPLLFVINPLYVVSDEPPIVKRLVPRSTTPDPANEPISSLLANFNVPLAFTVTAIAFANASPPLNVNVPAFTTVGPLNVFTPLNVSSAEPAFVNA
jgi:hypothetical protein